MPALPSSCISRIVFLSSQDVDKLGIALAPPAHSTDNMAAGAWQPCILRELRPRGEGARVPGGRRSERQPASPRGRAGGAPGARRAGAGARCSWRAPGAGGLPARRAPTAINAVPGLSRASSVATVPASPFAPGRLQQSVKYACSEGFSGFWRCHGLGAATCLVVPDRGTDFPTVSRLRRRNQGSSYSLDNVSVP